MKKTTSILAFLIVVITIIACTSNERQSSINNHDTSYLNKEQLSPKNTRNIWDTCGVMHNIILRKVIDNKSELGKNTDATIEYSLNQFHQMYDTNNSISTLTKEQIKTVMSDSINLYKNVIDNNINLSYETRSKLKDFFVIIENSANQENLTYSILKNRIVDFEDSIISSTMKESDKNDILKITSIARYSFYFWNQELDDTYVYSTYAKRPWWKWLVVGIADIAGGASGATLGAPTGLLAIGGAVAGAAGASAGASTLVDWISPNNP